MAVKPIALSFKNNKDDIELYEWITSHSNMSGFIKDILRAAMSKEETGHIQSIHQESKGANQLIDFNF
jgi:uncharacterized protein YegJ (DUF2314 family)